MSRRGFGAFLVVVLVSTLVSGDIALDTPHEKSMKVIGVGLSKTGTTSLSEAIKQLGLSSLHHDRSFLPFLYHNYSFEHAYDDLDAVFDLPTASYYEQLLQVYPTNSLYILTVRDESKWWTSFSNYYQYLVQIYGGYLPFRQQQIIQHTYGSVTPNQDLWRRAYREHNARVQRVIPADRLLIMNLADLGEGWDKLCPFLQKWGVISSDVESPCTIQPAPAFPREYSSDKVQQLVARSELHRICVPAPSATSAPAVDLSLPISEEVAAAAPRYAYVLFAADVEETMRREHFISALVAAKSLQATGTKADIVLLTMGHVSDEDAALMRALGLIHKEVHAVGYVREEDDFHARTDAIRRTRLRALLLIEYEVIISLEADMLVSENMDFLFEEMRHYGNASVVFAADAQGEAPISSAIFIAKPSCQDFISILDVARSNTFTPEHGWMKYGLLEDWRAGHEQQYVSWTFPYANADQGLLYYYYALYAHRAMVVHSDTFDSLVKHLQTPWFRDIDEANSPLVRAWKQGVEELVKFARQRLDGYNLLTPSTSRVLHDGVVHSSHFLDRLAAKVHSSALARLAKRVSDNPHAPLPMHQYEHLTEVFDPYSGSSSGGACVVSAWGDWTTCSKRCGGGTTTRSRTVTSQGKNCPTLKQSQSCYNEPCSYTRQAAVRLLYFAYASYCPQPALQSWNCEQCQESGFQVLTFLSDPSYNTFGYVGYSTKLNEIIVSFRGTEMDSIQNWVEDLKFLKGWSYVDNISGARAASGFEGAYSSIQSQTLAGVTSAVEQYPTASITVTGHSLGGAISTLCAVDLVAGQGYSDITHYTFGSPRVGDVAFATAYQSLVSEGQRIRVVNQADIVPHVPFSDLGFEHVAQEVWLHNGTTTVCDADNGEDPDGADSLWIWESLSVYDHLHYFNIAETC